MVLSAAEQFRRRALKALTANKRFEARGEVNKRILKEIRAEVWKRRRLRSKTAANDARSSSSSKNEQGPASSRSRTTTPNPAASQDRRKFEVHWHCILADPDNVCWHKFMRDVVEMVRNEDSRGFQQVIQDCLAMDEIFLAERSGAVAFGAAAFGEHASEIRGHELARTLGQNILTGVEMVVERWGFHVGFKKNVINSDGWMVTANRWAETEEEPMEFTIMCWQARALKLLKTFKTPCDDVVEEAEARTLLNIHMMEARESLWNGEGHEHIARRMSNAWKAAMRLPVARPRLQMDLGKALQVFNWLGTTSHDIAVAILETVVVVASHDIEVAARGNWMVLKAWESVDLPPAAEAVIMSLNKLRGSRFSLRG